MLLQDFGAMFGSIEPGNGDHTLMFLLKYSKAWKPHLITANVAQVVYPLPAPGAATEPMQARVSAWLGSAQPSISLTPALDNIVSTGGRITRRVFDAIISPNTPMVLDLSRAEIVIGAGDTLVVALGALTLRDGSTLAAAQGMLSVYGAPVDPAANLNVTFR